MQPLPDTRLPPLVQPTPGRHPATKTELLRQMLPADPRVQDEQDPLQHQPIIKRLAARIAKAPLALRQQRLNPLPQPIRHIPRLRPHRHPLQSLTTDADGLRYREAGPFKELELLRAYSGRGSQSFARQVMRAQARWSMAR